MLSVDPSLPDPPYEQIKGQIIDQRRSGALPAGHRLPTVRHLAAELGVAPNTVARAYRELEALGVIETRGRQGSFIVGTAASARAEGAQAARDYVARIRALGLTGPDAASLLADALGPLDGARRVLFVHAHPDDETLATGGLIAELVARGASVAVATATRGELGEVVDGPLAALAGTPELTAHRESELAAACASLGVSRHAFLGEPPARAAGLAPRRYTDSGMRWLDAAETLAGPGDAAGPDALTAADPGEVSADIVALARAVGADAIVSYDTHGGYGHPDHVALHAPSREAARALGVPFWEVASDPDAEPGFRGERVDTPQHLAVLQRALAHYASQLTVDGADVVHVGGQRQPIQTGFALRSR